MKPSIIALLMPMPGQLWLSLGYVLLYANPAHAMSMFP